MPALYGSFLSLSGEPAAVLDARHLGLRGRLDPVGLRLHARVLGRPRGRARRRPLGRAADLAGHPRLARRAQPRRDLPAAARPRLPGGAALAGGARAPGGGRASALLLVALAATHRLSHARGERWRSSSRWRWALAAAGRGARRAILRGCGVAALAALVLAPGVRLRPGRARPHLRRHAGLPGLPVDEGRPRAAWRATSSVLFTVLAVAALAVRGRAGAARDRARRRCCCAARRDRRARLLVAARDPARLLPHGLLPAARAGAARGARARAAAAARARRRSRAGVAVAGDRRVRLGPGARTCATSTRSRTPPRCAASTR